MTIIFLKKGNQNYKSCVYIRDKEGGLFVEDSYILARMLRKEEAVLSEIIEEYKAYVYVIVKQIIGEVMQIQDIEEVCNDVFYKLWASAHNINLDKGSIKIYLSAIARNAAKNKLRELKDVTLPIQDNMMINVPDAFSNMELQEANKNIIEAFRQLKPNEAKVFIRFYYYYEPIAKIAEDMHLNKNTVKSILRRGRRKLEKILKKREG